MGLRHDCPGIDALRTHAHVLPSGSSVCIRSPRSYSVMAVSIGPLHFLVSHGLGCSPPKKGTLCSIICSRNSHRRPQQVCLDLSTRLKTTLGALGDRALGLSKLKSPYHLGRPGRQGHVRIFNSALTREAVRCACVCLRVCVSMFWGTVY